MDTKQFIEILMGLTVAGLVLFALIGPIVNTQNQIDNIHYNGDNEYCIRMSYGTPTDDLTFVKPAGEMYVECYLGDAEEPYYIAPLNNIGQLGWIFCSSSYSFGITGGASNPMDYTSKYNNQGSSGNIPVADRASVMIDASTGKITTSGNNPDSTWAYYDNADIEHMYWADPNGDYINVNVQSSRYDVYIDEENAISGSAQIQANYFFYYDTDHVTTTNNKPAVVSTVTTEERGLYYLSSVPMQVTGLNDSINNVTSGHVIVKYQVQGTPATYSEVYNVILGMLPLLCGLGLLIVGIAYFVKRY